MSFLTSDVIVVGAGPTGLLLAGDLAAAGVAVTILERRVDQSNLTRAFAVHARTLEQLDARGVADELTVTGTTVTSLRVFGDVRVDLSRLPSRYPYLLVTPQYETERVLEERLEALGAKVERGAEVTGLRQDASGVDVEVRTGDGAVHTRRASYVVGADGGHSTVRQELGLPFPGNSAVWSVMLADVRLREAPEDVLTVNGVGDGFAFIAPFGDGSYRIIAWNRNRQVPDDTPIDLDELRMVTRRALGTDYGMHDPSWMSRFHSDERQVPRYRVHRVFVAGDAAQVHSPAGGQGMNTGLQDAANLGWKLAEAVHGRAGDDLLDTYETERHPVGRMVLRSSGALLRLALLKTPLARAARDVLAHTALRVPPLARRVATELSGVGITYPRPRGAHRLVGKRAPDVRLAAGEGDPARLYEALRSGRFVLVTGNGARTNPDDHTDVVAPAEPTSREMLVRPDGYIAWAT